ncbi:Cytochrome P450 [Mycena venus]|uniref:Cytochrome P450 n=1 Tax=Mycena venus TaxID=2733690 RepID=A0A8H6YKM1_9AGAR|nr:Cytochrome P450 [Mycena venus]
MESLTLKQGCYLLGSLWLLRLFGRRLLAVKRTLQDLRTCPGRGLLLVYPFGGPSLALDRWFPLRWRFHDYHSGFSLFAHYRSTVVSSLVVWDGQPFYWLSDADAIKIVCTSKSIFQKDLDVYEGFLNFYGTNIISTEGGEWKSHRAVARPAFNDANNVYVWEETRRIVDNWTNELNEAASEEIAVDLLKDFTKITMLVIASAGFGHRTSWDNFHEKQTSGRMPFLTALSASAHLLIPKSITPEWLIDLAYMTPLPILGPKLRRIRQSFNDIKEHMMEVVSHARMDTGVAQDAALLRNLVASNVADEKLGTKRLTDGELLSNTFVFLVAGHETTSHTLSFMVALLALHPAVQRKVYEEVQSLCDDPSAILVYTTAVFYETLRIFTVAPRLGRVVLADTTLVARRFKTTLDGNVSEVEEYPVHIKQRSKIIMDISAVHMNRTLILLPGSFIGDKILAIHWGMDVHEFRPERFIDTPSYRWPREAFLAFSTGPRSCIGQRFSTTESLCLVSTLVRKYEICVPLDLRSKSLAHQRSIVDWKTWLTMTPSNARVSLRRRN